MAKTILFNKPFQVISQFSPMDGKKTLADYIDVPGIYPAGRLDFDSEGLMLLTDDGQLQAKISHPKHKQPKCYLAQVEQLPSRKALVALRRGVELKDGVTAPAKVQLADEPEWLWPRNPPIRERRDIPTQWLEIEIHEGRNRQVRRMTAAVGHPTLRLIRVRVADWSLDGLVPGEWRQL
ncbi:MAG: pseudouridine synthase [Gammaproteobacteria bacterium]|nr:pseudouridine synthase [Gammaproteobacteria bacterium]